METPCFVRRRKSAAERRAQRHRSEVRFLQRAHNGLNDVHAHRGGTLTRFGWALRESLSLLSRSRGTFVPPAPADGTRVLGLSPHIDASSAPFHDVPAVEPSLAAHSSDIADSQCVSLLTPSEVGENMDAAVYVPMQFTEPSSCSDVKLAADHVSIGSGVEPYFVAEPSCSDVQVAKVHGSSGIGDHPDFVVPQQLFGKDGVEAVSGPADFWGDCEVAQPQCFLVLADLRSCGTVSKIALVAVQPFFFMVRNGLSFDRAALVGVPVSPSKEITPKLHDDVGGVKHDCNQQ